MYISFTIIFLLVVILLIYFSIKEKGHLKMLNIPEYQKRYLIKLITEEYLRNLHQLNRVHKEGLSTELFGSYDDIKEIYENLINSSNKVLVDDNGDVIDIENTNEIRNNIRDMFLQS